MSRDEDPAGVYRVVVRKVIASVRARALVQSVAQKRNRFSCRSMKRGQAAAIFYTPCTAHDDVAPECGVTFRATLDATTHPTATQ